MNRSVLKKTGILVLIFVLATVIAPFSPGVLAALIPLGLLQFPGHEKLPRIIRWTYIFWWIEAVMGFLVLAAALAIRGSESVDGTIGSFGPLGPEFQKSLSQFFARYSIFELVTSQFLVIASIVLYFRKQRRLIWVLGAEIVFGLIFSVQYIVRENFHWYPILDETALLVGSLIVFYSFYKKWKSV